MITVSCKDAVLDLLCFINLTKLGEIRADNLVNFKSHVSLYRTNTI